MIRILHLIVQIEDKPETNKILKEFKSELNLLLLKSWGRGEARIILSDSEDDVMEITREPRVYWFKGGKHKKDVLIFDAGYEGGSVYMYECKKDLRAEKDTLKKLKGEHGRPVSWRILREF